MPKVTQEYINKKKEIIIDATYKVCLKKTLSTVTMQDIINETGLSQGGIYRFYNDIDDIISDMILKLRNVSIKDKVDEIIGNDILTPMEVTSQLFDFLSDFMEQHLMTILKIDFELSILAMNNPTRVEKIVRNFNEMGNMEYLASRAINYFITQKQKGRISPLVDEKELLSYISSAFTGIQMQCIVAQCYKNTSSPLSEYYKPKVQLKLLAQAINHFLEGENRNEE